MRLKHTRNYRLFQETIDKVKELSELNGCNLTDVVENAILYYYDMQVLTDSCKHDPIT